MVKNVDKLVVERVRTGCAPFDTLLGGGLEQGVVTEIVGGAGCGKTTVGIMLAATCVLSGGTVAFIDTEGGLSGERLRQVLFSRGVPESRIPALFKKILVRRVEDFSEQDAVVTKLALKKMKDISAVIVDSITSNYRVERNDANTRAMNTRLAGQVRNLSRIASLAGIPVLVTNQEYLDFETKEARNVAGDVLRYLPKTIIRMSRPKLRRPGIRVATIIKHRSIPEGTRSAHMLLCDAGFSGMKAGFLRSRLSLGGGGGG